MHPRSRAISTVRSAEPESTTTTSSAHLTESRHRAMRDSSSLVMMQAESFMGATQHRSARVLPSHAASSQRERNAFACHRTPQAFCWDPGWGRTYWTTP